MTDPKTSIASYTASGSLILFDQNASDRHDAEFSRTFGQSKTAQQHRQRRRKSARSYKTPCY